MPPAGAYAGGSRADKMLLRFLRGAARDVADPEPRLETTPFIEAMHAKVFPAALHEDVVTVPGPRYRQRGVNNGAAVRHPSKFRMGDHVLEKAVPSSSAVVMPGLDE